jgi:protein gp37
MAEKTAIEWADATWNPWIGCTKVSPACDHCYAERDFDHRLHVVQWGAGQERKRTGAENWEKPLKWNKRAFYECEICGWRGDTPEMGFPGSILENLASCPSCDAIHLRDARRRVFCASLADVFDNEVPAEWREDLFRLIEQTPNLDWLLLTKRIGNVWNMLPVPFDFDRHYPNVWLGSTICNQTEADRDIPKLLDTPAAVRFVSIEPMLGPVSLAPCWLNKRCGYGDDHDRAMSHCFGCGALGGYSARCAWPSQSIDWVICGGESGPKARPMHPQWARDLRDQCAAAGVPFFMKQMTKRADIPADLMTREFPQ